MKATFLRIACGAALAAGLSSQAFAGIDFNTLTGNNEDPFSTYTENGFTVTSTTGSWFKAFNFGNPVPDIYLGPIGAPTPGSVTVTDGGGLFSFTSFDLSPNNGGGAGYTYTGSKLGIVLYSFSSTDSVLSAFSTITDSDPTLIDTLVISLLPNGQSSINIDNINYSIAAVPEPGTLSLLCLGGFAAFGIKRVRARLSK
jgi:PEP-CTERM motif